MMEMMQGVKASFRGIDMILEEDMNVKIVLFPDDEDPDSFCQKKKNNETMFSILLKIILWILLFTKQIH